MYRSEKLKRALILIMVCLMILSVPACLIRVFNARDHLTLRDLIRATGKTGTITAAQGDVLFDGTAHGKDIVGNLIGSSAVTPNTIAVKYSADLVPDFSVLQGIRGLEDMEGLVLETTLLPLASQKAIADAFSGKNGACFAYNYETGAVMCMLSLPSATEDDGTATDGALMNRCLRSVYIPGSTMKVITALCALTQNPGLEHFTYTCEGSRILPDGNTVKCMGGTAHGKLDLQNALGRSCNCYFSALAQELNVATANVTLQSMGFGATGNTLDRLTRTGSSTAFENNSTHSSLWSMVGQGKSTVSLIDFAMIAGAIASGGQAAQPYVVGSIRDPGDGTATYQAEPQGKQLASESASRQMYQLWVDATDRYYRTGQSALSARITAAKSGTAQQGNGTQNRLLLGFMEGYKVAFMIVVENVPNNDPTPARVANVLAQELSK